MVMSPINYLEFAQKDNIIFEFNYKNLVDKVFNWFKLDYSSFSDVFFPCNRVEIHINYRGKIKRKEITTTTHTFKLWQTHWKQSQR